jgi:hypothetical protein
MQLVASLLKTILKPFRAIFSVLLLVLKLQKSWPQALTLLPVKQVMLALASTPTSSRLVKLATAK